MQFHQSHEIGEELRHAEQRHQSTVSQMGRGPHGQPSRCAKAIVQAEGLPRGGVKMFPAKGTRR